MDSQLILSALQIFLLSSLCPFKAEELFGLSIMQKNEFYNKKFSTKYISTTKTPPPADFLCRSRDFYVSIVMRLCQLYGRDSCSIQVCRNDKMIMII